MINNKYSVMIIGSGGRENAMAHYFSQKCNIHLYCNSINPQLKTLANNWYSVGLLEPRDILEAVEENRPDLVVIGSENILIKGVSDLLTANGIPVLGPSKNLARIESSKIFSRRFLKSLNLEKYNPDYLVLRKLDQLKINDFWDQYQGQVVIKQDRLAGGKGVFVAGDHFETKEEFDQLVQQSFSKGDVMLEEKLNGIEFSLITLQDCANHQLHFPPVRDFKRRNCQDQGPNTGGMGCVSLVVEKEDQHWIQEAEEINQEVLRELEEIYVGSNYSGFLYGSFMLTSDGLKVIEFNARMGDPEGIGLFGSLLTPADQLVKHFLDNTLDQLDWKFKTSPYLTKYIVPGNYPNNSVDQVPLVEPDPEEISKLTSSDKSSISIHMASVIEIDQKPHLGGSRTLAVTCHDSDHISASLKVNKVLEYIQKLNQDIHLHFREDLGQKKEHWQLKQPSTDYVKGINYQDSGVDVNTNQEVVKKIKEAVINTYHNPLNLGEVKSDYGLFSGLIKVKKSGGLSSLLRISSFPLIAATTDGTGTKSLFVHQQLGLNGFESLGQDLVNHCVNDLMVQGAQPLMFLDYFASSKIKTLEVRKFLDGCSKACLENNCIIGGGETAEMPDVYQEGAHDLVGTMIGLLQGKALDPLHKIKNGDIVLALPSHGPHTNGYSLIRKVVQQVQERGDQVPVEILNEWTQPHRSYKKDIDELLKKKIKVKGMAHITGGGLIENPPRILPSHLAIDFDTKSWTLSEGFQYLQKETQIDDHEMRKTFNCGVGLLIVISPSEYSKLIRTNYQHLDGLWAIGKVVNKKISDLQVYFN